MPSSLRAAIAAGAALPSTTIRISPATLGWLPVFAMAVYLPLLVFPGTESLAISVVQENGPVELLTFLFLAVGGAQGLRLATGLRRRGGEGLAVAHYALFSLGLLFIAMEEVAWGQHLLGFQTPAAIEAVNQQGELTLHNMGRLQGRSEIFRLAFGAAACVGLLFAWIPAVRKLAVPGELWPVIALITLAATLDTYNDFFPLTLGMSNEQWRWASEFVEMLIGAAGLLYLQLNLRLLRAPYTGR